MKKGDNPRHCHPLAQANVLIFYLLHFLCASIIFILFLIMFCRILKAENERYQKEMDFQLKMMELENQPRTQEREHEMRFISLLMGNNRQNQNVPQPLIHYPNLLPNNLSDFLPSSSYINQLNSTPLNVSDTSSDTSSLNIEEGLYSYYSL